MGEHTINIKNLNSARKKCLIFLFGTIFIFGFIAFPVFFNDKDSMNRENTSIKLIQNPTSSAIINFTIYLFDIDVDNSSAYRGDEIILRGWAEKANISLGQMVPANGHTLYVVIDDVLDQLFSGDTDSSGNFTIVFPIPYDYDIDSIMKIQADLSQDETHWESKCFNQFFLEIDAKLNVIIDDSVQGPAFAYSSNPGFSNYRISGHIELDDGSSYNGPSFNMNFTFEDNLATLSSIPIGFDGTFDHFIWLEEGYSYFTLDIINSSDFAAYVNTFDFKVITDLIIDFEEYPNPGYENQSTPIRGVISSVVNGETIPISQAEVNISFLGIDYNLFIDTNGVFQTYVDIPPNNIGIQPITVELISYGGYAIDSSIINGIDFNEIINARIELAPPDFPFEIIIIVVVAVAGIVGVFVFQRWRLSKAEQTDKLKLTKKELGRLDIINILLNSGRVKESIAYLYIIYIDLSALRYDIERKPSQTFRDFAIMMVKEFGQNPQTIYPFMLKIEKVVYGGFPTSQETFNEIKPIFEQLYLETTGQVLSLEV